MGHNDIYHFQMKMKSKQEVINKKNGIQFCIHYLLNQILQKEWQNWCQIHVPAKYKIIYLYFLKFQYLGITDNIIKNID